MKLLSWLNKLIMAFSGLMLGLMTVLVILQVFWRYVLEMPFPQSQELAIYAMVYVVMFGSTIAVYNKTHIAVNFIVERVPAKFAFILRMTAYVMLIIFFYLLIKEGWALSLRAMRQLSPTTGIPVGYIMASVPISSAISMLYVFGQMYTDIKGVFVKKSNEGEQL